MVIVQKPNPPIIIAVTANILSRFCDGWLASGLFMISIAALAYWSYLEITKGYGPFRRLLGYLGSLLALHMFVHFLLY